VASYTSRFGHSPTRIELDSRSAARNLLVA